MFVAMTATIANVATVLGRSNDFDESLANQKVQSNPKHLKLGSFPSEEKMKVNPIMGMVIQIQTAKKGRWE